MARAYDGNDIALHAVLKHLYLVSARPDGGELVFRVFLARSLRFWPTVVIGIDVHSGPKVGETVRLDGLKDGG